MSSAESQAAHIQEVVAAGGVVDSILPVDEALRRFQATLPPRPDSLSGGSETIESLVQRWSRAVSARDTADMNAIVITRAEFGWLYYPGSRLSKPPYEAPPQLLWEQVLNSSDEGARKLFARFGGMPFRVTSTTCPGEADTTAASIAHTDCTVRVTVEGRTIDERLFGSIIEYRGRFKFLGYANRL